MNMHTCQSDLSQTTVLKPYLFSIEQWELLAAEADFQPYRIAAACGFTTRQLQRIFQRKFGMTPRHWLRLFQCRLATDLVREGYSNKQIVQELKFASSSHFCREFKKVYG